MYTSRFRRRRNPGHRPFFGGNRRRRRGDALSRYLRRRYSDPVRYRSSNFRRFRYGPPMRRPRPWERDAPFLPTPPRDDPEPMDVDVRPPPEPEIPEAPVEEIAKVLHIKSIDLQIKKNTKEHHTDEYEVTKDPEDRNEEGDGGDPELVIRRGQDFKMSIEFDRPYHMGKNDLELIFRTGINPRPGKSTEVSIKVDEPGQPVAEGAEDEEPDWSARIDNVRDNWANLTVYTPPDAIIGEWKLSISTTEKVKSSDVIEIFEYDYPDEIYLILNPWCKDDTCYMPTTQLLDEYVLNDKGAIYTGNAVQMSAKLWNFAQYEDGCFFGALHLLRKAFGGDTVSAMSDPVKISRALSQWVNNADDNGVLAGNWSGDYEGGRRPTHWSGTKAIMDEYMKTKQPVKFGQCWVFSGILTTMCRAIGLPSRSVTNFSSAHDTDGDITIDSYKYRKEDGSLDPESHGADSVWNFHVWNEAWMSRPDLPDGYDGWQVIDATPQESSGGIFCCGPSPMAAIKKGEVHIGYDTAFIVAEVNADKVTWVKELDGKYHVISVNTNSVGQNISTKCPTGRDYEGNLGPSIPWYDYRRKKEDKDREDLTHHYKYPEESLEERKAHLNALEKSGHGHRNIYSFSKKEDVKIQMIEKDNILVGQNFTVDVLFYNNSKQNRTLHNLLVTVDSVDYTGKKKGNIIKKKYEDKTLKPVEEYVIQAEVSVDDYVHKLVDQGGMLISLEVYVKETAQICFKDFNWRLRRPELKVELPASCKLGDSCEVVLSFTNPLPIPLTDCNLDVEGPGISLSIPVSDVGPKKEFKKAVTVKPKRKGKKQVSGDFDSKELINVTGYSAMEVI